MTLKKQNIEEALRVMFWWVVAGTVGVIIIIIVIR